MSSARAARPAATASERAIGALETLLDEQRAAMVAGDVAALEAVHTRIHALLSDAAWRRDAARGRSPLRVRAALKAAAINAGLAARGEAQAARSLSAMGATPALYTASGALGALGTRARNLTA